MAHDRSKPDERSRADDAALIARLLAGEEAAFAELLDTYYASMVRVARGFLHTEALAEEVVQETWFGVLKGLRRFEGRSSLKTWIFRILVNRCITRRKKEGRSLPFSALGSEDEERPAVDPARFAGRGGWSQPPELWEKDTPEKLVLRSEAMDVLAAALEELPDRQRIVVTMRDIEGLDSSDVCNVLEISESNQRVLLHRGRSRLRAKLEEYLRGMAR